jgi:hypothetical protein
MLQERIFEIRNPSQYPPPNIPTLDIRPSSSYPQHRCTPCPTTCSGM